MRMRVPLPASAAQVLRSEWDRKARSPMLSATAQYSGRAQSPPAPCVRSNGADTARLVEPATDNRHPFSLREFHRCRWQAPELHEAWLPPQSASAPPPKAKER